MRGSNSPEVQVGFQGAPDASLSRTVLLEQPDFIVEKLEWAVEQTFTSTMTIGANTGIFMIREAGAILTRSEAANRWYLTPMRGVGASFGPRHVLVRVAKGEHLIYLASWKLDHANTLTRLMREISRNLKSMRNESGFGMPMRPIVPRFESASERFYAGVTHADASIGESLIWSAITEGLAYLGEPSSDSMLAPVPSGLPEPIQEVLQSVRANPRGTWSLKEATEAAQYSPFHFSRLFKQVVGYGFHDFVDRVRTELGAELLMTSQDSIEVIALKAGFANSKAFRDTMREFLGIPPTEFRREPDQDLIR